MKSSFLSAQLRRAGETLRQGASEQILMYTKRFEAIKGIYPKFFRELMQTTFNTQDALSFAYDFFGSTQVPFAAVDGTEYTRSLFDLVIFFGGSYAAKGVIEFTDNLPQVEYSTKLLEEGIGLSSCVPMYVNEIVDVEHAYIELAEDRNITIDRTSTDEEVINNSSIANWLMTFSELYLAYQLTKQEGIKVLFMDRSLCTMHSSLVYDTRRRRRLWNTLAILGYKVDTVPIDDNDLVFNRHRILNEALYLPPARGDYLRYAIVYLLERKGPLKLREICRELQIDSIERRTRVQRFLRKTVEENYLIETQGVYEVAPQYENSWPRIRRLVEEIGHQLFEAIPSGNPMQIEKEAQKVWLTTLDLAFLSLFCLYMLIEECWRKQILLLGMTKDTTARDFKRHLIPVCLTENIWKYSDSREKLENAPNTDRMLLQYVSIYNHDTLPTPWSLIEYDSAFRVIIPELELERKGYVSGAIRNRITPERVFVKTYIQLSEATMDPQLRSNVLFIDRLVYPQYDFREDTTVKFHQVYSGVEEPIEPILFKSNRVMNRIQNLVMVMLKALATASIPEVFGHNMPLFIADKVAKWHNSEVRRIIDSTGVWVANNHDLRRFVFYMSTFRERRSELESSRR